MSRPTRQGVDYFPLDVYLDDKFKFIQIKYKLEGFGVLIKLLQRIYSYGYWCNWTEDEALIFADENRAELSLIENVVAEAISRGIFDEKLFNEYNILTSRGIQKRYQEIVKRRKDVEVVTEYLLTDNNFGVNVDIMPTPCKHNVDISTQSKVDKSKVNKIKVDKSKVDDEEDDDDEPLPNKYIDIINEWNQLGLSQIKSIKSTRLNLLRARVNEFSVDEIVQAIKLISTSSFLKGQNDRGWIITFDWFIKPNNFIKVLEGNYIDKEIVNKPKKSSNPFLEMMQDEIDKGGYSNE